MGVLAIAVEMRRRHRRHRHRHPHKPVRRPTATPTRPAATPRPTPQPTAGASPTPTQTTAPTQSPAPTQTPSPSPSQTPAAGTTLGAADRHLVRRFSAGLTPALAAEVNAAGGARAWFEQQLDPTSLRDPAGDEVDRWFAYLGRSPEEIYQRARADTEATWRVMADLSRRTVSRRLHSSRQVQEVMVDFWSNLLHVPITNDDAAYARADYDKVIRTYALDSFEALLQNAITHPAMGINLNNNVSSKAAPNENLGRELLELHTVGVDAGYTESEVKASARILTGYRVDLWPAFKAYYHQPWHATGEVSVMGFSSANASPDGRAVTMAYLSHLARHERTARRIARRLCVKFVRDDPSDSLVTAVASAYRANGTRIRPTLRAMVDHPDFAASVGMKLRSPQEDWQAMVRALGITVHDRTADDSFLNAMYWQYRDLGAAPYEWAAPNGYPEVNAAWSGAGRMLNSFATHRNMTAHWWPTKDADLPALSTLTPALPATLQQVVDATGLRVLGQTPGPRISQAVATALNVPLSHVVTAREADWYWTRITIVSTLLDSPLHLHR